MSASLFDAMANEVRLSITLELGKGEKSARQLATDLGLRKASVANSLKSLMDDGVVSRHAVDDAHAHSLTEGFGRQALGLIDWHRNAAGSVDLRLAQLRRDKRFLPEMSANPCPVLITKTPEGVVVYANRPALKLLKARSAEEVIGKDMLDFVHADDRKKMRRGLKRLTDGELLPCQLRTMRRLDGTLVETEITAAPTFMFDADVLVMLLLPNGR